MRARRDLIIRKLGEAAAALEEAHKHAHLDGDRALAFRIRDLQAATGNTLGQVHSPAVLS